MRHFFSRRSLVACVIAMALAGQVCGQESIYQVGNSFTWDSQPNSMAAMAANLGSPLEIGYHIRCNSSATLIVEEPTYTCVTPTSYGKYPDALPDYDWDHVTIQSFRAQSQNATLGSETAAISQIVATAKQNPNNIDTQFYIYQSWFSKTGSLSPAQWETPVTANPAADVQHRRQYFSRLREAVADAGHDLLIVPTGDALYRVLEEINNGTLPGISSIDELYRDNIHMSYDLGRLVASTTMLATILKSDPTGVETPFSVNSALTEQIQSIVWDVVKHHPESGIATQLTRGDYNDDGEVDSEDYAMWKNSYGSTTRMAADGNHDFRVDASDYAVWRSQLTATTSAATTPEATSVALALHALLAYGVGCRDQIRNAYR